MKVIGPKAAWSEIELDPERAFHRARALDALLSAALPRPPRGVSRGFAADFARADELRLREAARRLNAK